MSEVAGYEGAVYYRHGYFSGTVSFADASPSADTITASSLSSAGFAASDTIEVTGTTSNDGNYTIASISASVITLSASDTLTSQASVASTVIQTLPGTQLGGFHNWTVTYDAGLYETTAFEDAGTRTYISGYKGWSATADKYYLTSSSKATWVTSGSTIKVRFFINYESSPSSTAAHYLEGSAVVVGYDTTTPIDGAITQSMRLQGKGALSFVTRSTAWA